MSRDMMSKRTVAVTTLGCKVNQFESASFITKFLESGLEVVPFSQAADIYVINSCAVTGKAGAQSRQLLRKALRTNPRARIIMTGCYAQVSSQEVFDLADTPVCIVGNGNKHLLVDIALSDTLCDRELYMGAISRKHEICDLPVTQISGRTRAYIKIQDGCDNFCSYCIVPYARGRVRSLPPEKVMEQLDVFAQQGYREIVLTGIHVGRYGSDLAPRTSLTELVRVIDGRDDGIGYRISSLEPGEITGEMLACIAASRKFMPHFHLPLQSGDDSILKEMNRRYGVAEFSDTVARIISAIPEVAIGLDVLVGFPGEDDQAFANTMALIEILPVAYLHVFPYSKRPGTAAATLPGHLPKKIKEERAALLRELDRRKRLTFYGKYIGATRLVLAESDKNRVQMMKGFTDNYIPVHFEAPGTMANRRVEVTIDRVVGGDVFGHIDKGSRQETDERGGMGS